MEANPTVLRVSLSGYSQEKYEITHKGGNVEDVKKNLDLLLQIKEDSKSTTRIVVAFLRYLSNLEEENIIKQYCEKTGIAFLPINALILPLEKEFLVGNYLENSLFTLQVARRQHGACSVCLKHGVSNYFLYNIPNMDAIVAQNIHRYSNLKKTKPVEDICDAPKLN